MKNQLAPMSAVEDINEEDLARLVALFYERVRKDPEIGPIFNDAVEDWPAHLAKLTNFWHAVMLTSGRYKGNPMVAHMRQKRIRPEHFDRWLALWNVATAEVMAPPVAAALQAKAARIGESLKLALFFKIDPPPDRSSQSVRHDMKPYRSTPIFDETTLPAALRTEHNTKSGAWGVICVLEGRLAYTILDPPSKTVLTPGNPGLVTPLQKHFVTPLGPMRMRVDFFTTRPPI